MAKASPSYEYLLRHCQSQSGLYVLGAGATGGLAPFGTEFWSGPARTFLRDISAFPVELPRRTLLAQRLVEAGRPLRLPDIYPERPFRPGEDDQPLQDILLRLTDFYARTSLKHSIARPRYERRRNHNYEVFNAFYPSMLSNYNHDGLAEAICRPRHRVVTMHGTVEAHFGRPAVADFLATTREFDLALPPDNLLMGVPETGDNLALLQRLQQLEMFAPAFIAIIGYTFARSPVGDRHDDQISLEWLLGRFRGYTGTVFVIDPYPDATQAMLSDGLQCRNVLAVKAYWNVLSHVIMRALYGPPTRRSLNYQHEELLDRHGRGRTYPAAGSS